MLEGRWPRISSFEKKPASGGKPAMAMHGDQHRQVRAAACTCAGRPSCACPARRRMPWMTEPAPRKRQALKKACVMTWKIAGGERADADGDEHEAELRDGRVGEDLLDVVLRDADRRREERRERADDRHDHHRVGRQAEEHVRADDHVDAGRDHRGGVDQRGDRRRAGHGVRQPDVQRDLRRLAARADEEQQADGGGDAGVRMSGSRAASAKTLRVVDACRRC